MFDLAGFGWICLSFPGSILNMVYQLFMMVAVMLGAGLKDSGRCLACAVERPNRMG
jgi:hypothetical protein